MHRIFTAVVAGCLLVASVGSAWAESEFNNSRSESNDMSIPGSVNGNLQSDGGGESWPGPIDYFRFTIASPMTVTFTASVTGGGLGPDVVLDIENSSGDIIRSVSNNSNGGGEVMEYTFASAGTYYLVVWEATGTPNAFGSYTVTASSVASGPDTTAPTWTGTAGVDTATRQPGNTQVYLTWHQATDNVTAQAALRYDIYYSTAEATVFSAGVKTTSTGLLSTTVTGLDAGTTYYFGVRARDEENNRDANTRTVQNAPLPNAAHDWELYQ